MTQGLLFVLGAACGVCLGCSPEPAAAPPMLPVARAASESQPRDRSENSDSTELDAALQRMVSVRKLQPLAKVEFRQVNRAQMGREVERHIAREVPKNVIQGQSDVLRALGLVPADFDYLATILHLMTDKLAGFYDPRGNTMFLAADLSPEDRRVTLRHELVHALQDQHYDLAAGLAYRPDVADAQSALHGLAEGDATSAMLDEELGPDAMLANDDLLAERISEGFADDLPGIPGILKRSAVAPYIDGLLFVNHLRRQSGWRGVDAAWRDPPKTSEQLLHPDKYVSRERPSLIPPAPERSGCEQPYTDVLGEQALRLVLEEWVTPGEAKQAAAGWDGDRVTVFVCNHDKSLHWQLAFDTVKDAEEAAELFEAGLLRCGKLGTDERGVQRTGPRLVVTAPLSTDCPTRRPQATP